MTRNQCEGFSLIELVIVMIIISVGILGIASQLGNNTTSLTTNETLQQATQYAQECAERVIAARRDSTFSAIGFPVSGSATWSGCNSLGPLDGLTGYARTVTLCHTVTGSGTSTCPNGITCGYAVVTVYPTTPTPTVSCPADATGNATVTTTNPSVSSSITVMLVDY